MKRVQITVYPENSDFQSTYESVTGSDEQFVRVQVLNWNVTTSPAAFLLRISGDIQRFETILEEDDIIDEYELLPVTETESYCFVAGVGTTDARALWKNFKRGSLMTIPPAEWNPDGSYTFTIVGRDVDIQTAVDNVPMDAHVEIESVGGKRVTTDSVVDRLSDRQRDAVQTAVKLGYYDTPRKATSEDIAYELDCATSTAAEHLRKAESKILTGLVSD